MKSNKQKIFYLMFGLLLVLWRGELVAYSNRQGESPDLSNRQRKALINKISEQKQNLLKNPGDHQSHLKIATLYWKLGSSGKPIRHYLTAIKLKPDYAIAYYGLGNVFYAQGETEQALQSYRKATEIDPQLAEAFNGLGNVSVDQKEYLRAIDFYKRALKLKENYQEASHNLCSAYLYSAQYRKGAQYCEKAIQNSPRAETYNNLGNIYFRLGSFDKAKTVYQVALKINDQLSDAHYNLAAISLIHNKNKTEARQREKILQKLNPRQSYELGKLIQASGL